MTETETNLNRNFEPASKGDVETIKWVLIAIVAVLLIGLGGLFESWLASQQASSEDLKDQIIQQNDKIDLLSRQICQQDKLMGLTCSN